MKQFLLLSLFCLLILSMFSAPWAARYLYWHGPELVRIRDTVKENGWIDYEAQKSNGNTECLLGLTVGGYEILVVGLLVLIATRPSTDELDVDKKLKKSVAIQSRSSGIFDKDNQ